MVYRATTRQPSPASIRHVAVERNLPEVRGHGVERPEDRMPQISRGHDAGLSRFLRREHGTPLEQGRQHRRIDLGPRRDEDPSAGCEVRPQ